MKQTVNEYKGLIDNVINTVNGMDEFERLTLVRTLDEGIDGLFAMVKDAVIELGDSLLDISYNIVYNVMLRDILLDDNSKEETLEILTFAKVINPDTYDNYRMHHNVKLINYIDVILSKSFNNDKVPYNALNEYLSKLINSDEVNKTKNALMFDSVCKFYLLDKKIETLVS